MSQTIATESAVHLAADRLYSEGQEVTIDAVRALVGGGSQTTVLRHLQRWRELPRQNVAAPPVPASVLACFDHLKHKLWFEIWSLSARDLEIAKEHANAEVEGAKQQAAEAFMLSERHEVELDQLREATTVREARLALLESQLQEVEATRCRAAALEADLEECGRTLEKCKARERECELLSARLSGEITGLEGQLETVELQRKSERERHLARVTELERREASASEAAMRHTAVEQELSACRAELAACRAELALWRGGAAAGKSAPVGP